jgi:hypothetical protein
MRSSKKQMRHGIGYDYIHVEINSCQLTI